MDKEVLEFYKDKKIRIFLKERIIYTGHILKDKDGKLQIFETSLLFLDKYSKQIAIPFSQIERIEEEASDEQD